MKKFISLLLAFSLILVFMAPAMAVGEERLPIIYIRGNGEPLYDADGNVLVTGLDNVSLGGDSPEGEEASAEDKIVEAAVNILKPFVLEGMLFDEWDNYGKAIYDELAPLFVDAGLDENGNAKNGTGVSPAVLAASEAASKSAASFNRGEDYHFCFDWRLSPYDHVDRLHAYIQDIMKATGKTQVNLWARCLGGGLLMAYIERYGDEGHIKNVMFCEVLSNETTVISKAMSGKVDFDAALLENYLGQVDFLGRTGEGQGFAFTDLLNEIVFRTMDFFNQITVTDTALDEIEKLYNKLYKALMPAILHASGMATQVNYWTCVGEDDMDAALELIFGEEDSELREKYAGLIDKILYYREHVSSDLRGFYDSLSDKDIYFGFTAKYGFINAPFTEEQNYPTDALVSLTHATFGATTSSVHRTLPDEYVANRIEEGNGKYISPDRKIDLTTAYAPDRTWILKNAHHDNITFVLPIIYEFLNGTNETVDTMSAGSQYMIYDYDTNSVSVMTEDNCKDLDFVNRAPQQSTPFTILEAFFRFLSVLVDIIFSIFDGTFDFGSLIGQ